MIEDIRFKIDINNDQSIQYLSDHHTIDQFQLIVRRTSRNRLLSEKEVIDEIQNTLDHYCNLVETQNAEFIVYE